MSPTEGGGRIKMERMEDGKFTQTDWKAATIRVEEFYRLVVRAIGCDIEVELCTVAEAEGNCLRGTGCGHDKDLIWTSDEGTIAGPASA